MHIKLVTCTELPNLHKWDLPLLDAFKRRGIDAEPAIWDKVDISWDKADAVVLRSTWDYYMRLPEFTAWIDSVAPHARLFNAAELVRWNLNKRYLDDLANKGVPVIDTVWAAPGERLDLDAVFAKHGWDAAVVKPAVSAGAHKTRLFQRVEASEGQALVDDILTESDVMVQTYLPEVSEQGEIALMYFDGQLSHAVNRGSMLVGGEDANEQIERIDATPEYLALGQAALAALPSMPLYARVDIARSQAYGLRLLELELIEPSLFFNAAPESVDHFVDTLLARLEKPVKAAHGD